jgi:DoxX-like family
MSMQATLAPADLSIPRSSGLVVGFWIATALFCLQIGFTAYAQLSLPVVAEAFAHLGFPDYFRVELALAKLLGVVVLLVPLPARLKEWAYAGFAITPRLGADRAPLGGRWSGSMGLVGGCRRAVEPLVFLVAPPAGVEVLGEIHEVHEGEDVDQSAFRALVRQAVAFNRSGKSKTKRAIS